MDEKKIDEKKLMKNYMYIYVVCIYMLCNVYSKKLQQQQTTTTTTASARVNINQPSSASSSVASCMHAYTHTHVHILNNNSLTPLCALSSLSVFGRSFFVLPNSFSTLKMSLNLQISHPLYTNVKFWNCH